MANFKILKPTSTDAGHYTAFKCLKWGSVVAAELVNTFKTPHLEIKGEELIKIGADAAMIVPDRLYMWGPHAAV